MDGSPEDEKEFLRWAQNIRGYNLAYVYKKRFLFRSILSRGKDYIKKRTIAKFVPFLPANEVINRVYSLARQYPYETSKYIARIGIADTFRTLPDRWESTYAEFEGKLFRIPKGFDEILTKQYGDYMTFPPVENQVIHHSNCVYWRKK